MGSPPLRPAPAVPVAVQFSTLAPPLPAGKRHMKEGRGFPEGKNGELALWRRRWAQGPLPATSKPQAESLQRRLPNPRGSVWVTSIKRFRTALFHQGTGAAAWYASFAYAAAQACAKISVNECGGWDRRATGGGGVLSDGCVGGHADVLIEA
eukprot:365428-Chlamydomonas_euryale.AAC.26